MKSVYSWTLIFLQMLFGIISVFRKPFSKGVWLTVLGRMHDLTSATICFAFKFVWCLVMWNGLRFHPEICFLHVWPLGVAASGVNNAVCVSNEDCLSFRGFATKLNLSNF